MRRVAIVQARMTSTRLPGKVLMDIAGRPMLAQQLRRLKQCQTLDEIVVATTGNATDDPVVALADVEGVRWYRGSEPDVLRRFVEAAREADAELVVRSTADCPLIMPEVVDRVVSSLVTCEEQYDYVSNVVERTFPIGLDVEAMFRDTLERTSRLASSPAAREHVTYYILHESAHLFLVGNICDSENNSDLRWTVDTAEDLRVVRSIYEQLGLGERDLNLQKVVRFVRGRAELVGHR